MQKPDWSLSHRLLDGNNLATEMDGATQAAWPQR